MQVDNFSGGIFDWLVALTPETKREGIAPPDYSYDMLEEIKRRKKRARKPEKNRKILFIVIATTLGIVVAQNV